MTETKNTDNNLDLIQVEDVKPKSNLYIERNPVLNSADDITDELLERILNNELDSLTINYEFTKSFNEDDYEHYDYDEYLEFLQEIDKTNPFRRANNIKPIRRIEFEIILTPTVTSLAYAFEEFDKLEYVNLKDTSNITDMAYMFYGAKKFNQPIGDWDTSKVTYMRSMFASAAAFNQPIGDWDTSKVRFMDCMFSGAMLFNQPIGDWDTSKVINMSCMFREATSFNQPIGDWNTSNVTDISSMFKYARSFNQYLGNWDISKVTDKQGIFKGATAYKYSRLFKKTDKRK